MIATIYLISCLHNALPICFLGFLLPNRTKTVSLPSYCTDLFSFTLFLHSGKVKIESGTENEAGTDLSFGRVCFTSLPATANKGHLGQLVHLAQLHSARASLWRVPSFQSINIVQARYSYSFCLAGTKNSIFNEFWVWTLSSPYFHISSYKTTWSTSI